MRSGDAVVASGPMRPRGSFGFGLARSLDFHTSLSRFTEFCELLSASVGHLFYPHHALSYAELRNGLSHGELGLAWTPPIPAIDLVDRNMATLLVAPIRRGSTLYHAAIITRENGPQSLADLRGGRAGWVDRDSSAGYLAPRLYFAENGLDPRKIFSNEVFLGSHIAVVDAIAAGRIDVGGCFCKIEPHTGRVLQGAWTDGDGKPRQPIHVLATIGPIPNDTIVAATRLSAELQTKVFRWFLDPGPRAHDILTELFRADACRAPTPSHYEPLRKMISTAITQGDVPWRRSSTTRPPPPVG